MIRPLQGKEKVMNIKCNHNKHITRLRAIKKQKGSGYGK